MCNVCGRNLITGLTSAASPRVDISSTCKVGQKLGVSLPLSTCSPSAWPFRLLYRRGRKSRRDLWITLHMLLPPVNLSNACVHTRESTYENITRSLFCIIRQKGVYRIFRTCHLTSVLFFKKLRFFSKFFSFLLSNSNKFFLNRQRSRNTNFYNHKC